MKVTFVLAAGLMLGGCGAILPASSGFTTGWLANPGNDLAVLNAAMVADAPIKQAWCDNHAALPPAVAAYCAKVPTDVRSLSLTISRMLQAEMAPAR